MHFLRIIVRNAGAIIDVFTLQCSTASGRTSAEVSNHIAFRKEVENHNFNTYIKNNNYFLEQTNSYILNIH